MRVMLRKIDYLYHVANGLRSSPPPPLPAPRSGGILDETRGPAPVPPTACGRPGRDGQRRFLGAVGLACLLAACAGPRALPTPRPGELPAGVGAEETGDASWYGIPYHGRRAAGGETYDMNQMTAAHRSLPFGTWVAVENLANGRTAEVRITDRGPFVAGRILDLSGAAARALDALGPGVIPVRLRVLHEPEGEQRALRGGYAVQVAAFTSEDRAVRFQAELERRWAGAVIRRADLAGRLIFRVRLGPFPNRDEARRVAEDLAAAGYTVFVVPE